MEFLTSRRMKLKCSGQGCNHVYEYTDTEYYLCNDPGEVVFRCPECKALTKAEVHNVDHFRYYGRDGKCHYQNDAVYACESKWEECAEEYADVPRGEFREYVDDVDVQPKAIPQEPVWLFDGRDFDAEGRGVMTRYAAELDKELATIVNGYLAGVAGADSISRLEIRVKLSDRQCRYVKEVRSERDINAAGLTLIEVEGVNPEDIIDGVFTRDRCLAILNNMLMRWRLECREVFLVSPFIGFQYTNKKYAREICEFWRWLSAVTDIDKTTLITRKCSLSSLKSAYTSIGKSYEELRKWNDISTIVTMADSYDGRKKGCEKSAVKLFHKSHAKFYAGVYDDYVEVIVGSYNLHSGSYYENMMLRRYEPEQFSRNYLAPFNVSLHKPAYNHAQPVLKAVIEIDADKGVMPAKLE